MPAKYGKITARDLRFAELYMVNRKPREAAVGAGYSDETAKTKAYQWVSDRQYKPSLYDHIEKLKAAQTKKAGITAERVLQELTHIATVQVSDYISETGFLVEKRFWSPEMKAALSSIEVTPAKNDGDPPTYKIKLWSKSHALGKLGDHFSLFDKNVNLTVTDALSERMANARARAKNRD